MKTKPWRVEKTRQFHKDPVFYHTDVVSGGTRVARVAGIGEDESREHARLIATAPELLEALKEITIDLCAVCIAHNPQHKDCTSCPATDNWRALITKAESK